MRFANPFIGRRPCFVSRRIRRLFSFLRPRTAPGNSNYLGEELVNELRNYAGQRVSTRVGSDDGTDDIDAVCVIDPEYNELDSHYGIALGTLPLPPVPAGPMGLSVVRSRTLQNQEFLHVQVTGFGPHSPADGIVAFLISFDASPLPTNWFDGGTRLRYASGDAVEQTYPIPANFSAPTTTLMALSMDVNGRLAGTWMCRLNIRTP